MDNIAQRLKIYIEAHPFDPGDSDCETVLDQLYQAYAESHESDPPEIGEGFKELECFLETLPLSDNNAVFNLCCRPVHSLREKSLPPRPDLWGTPDDRAGHFIIRTRYEGIILIAGS